MAQNNIAINQKRQDPLAQTLALVLFLGLCVFVLYPLFMVVKASLLKEGAFSLEFYKEILHQGSYVTPLLNSLKLAVWTAIVGTIVGYVFAYLLTMTGMPLKNFFRTVATVPLISPPFIIALAAIMLLGRNGYITQHYLIPMMSPHDPPSVYGFWGLLIVETIAYFPTAFLLLVSVFASIDPVLDEAAQNQGATKWQIFRDVTFPLSVPGILSSLLLIFIESLADFGNPLILSGDFKVLSVEAYLKITGEYDTSSGSILALFLLVPSLVAFFVQKYYVDKKSYVTMTGKPSSSKRKQTSRLNQILLFSVGLFFTLPIIGFYTAIVFGSLVKTWGADNTFTFQNYISALDFTKVALMDSLLLSAIAAPITAILGMIIAFLIIRKSFRGKTAMELISMLTFAVPGTVVGIGYILAFNDKPILLTGTASIIIILFIFRNAPVGIQAGMTALRQIDPSIEEASANLGAGAFTTFRKIALPLISPAFFSALAYSFVRSITAISAVIFVVSGQWNLVTIAILGFVENSALSKASAMCVILIVLVSFVLSLMRLLTSRMGVQR